MTTIHHAGKNRFSQAPTAPFEHLNDRLNYLEVTEVNGSEFVKKARAELSAAEGLANAAKELLNATIEGNDLIDETDRLSKALAKCGIPECDICERHDETVAKFQAWNVCSTCKQDKIEMDREREAEAEAERTAKRKKIAQPFLEFTDEETAEIAADELKRAARIYHPYTQLASLIFFETINDQHNAIDFLEDAVGMSGLLAQRHPL